MAGGVVGASMPSRRQTPVAMQRDWTRGMPLSLEQGLPSSVCLSFLWAEDRTCRGKRDRDSQYQIAIGNPAESRGGDLGRQDAVPA